MIRMYIFMDCITEVVPRLTFEVFDILCVIENSTMLMKYDVILYIYVVVTWTLWSSLYTKMNEKMMIEI